MRKLAYTDEIKSEIARQVKVQTAPAKILSTLRLNGDEENPIFKTRDLYNLKTEMKRTALGPLTPVQALMKQLDGQDWEYNYQQNDRERLTHLFFSKGLISLQIDKFANSLTLFAA